MGSSRMSTKYQFRDVNILAHDSDSILDNLVAPKLQHIYRVGLEVGNLDWVDFVLVIPLSARFCFGRWKLDRIGWVARVEHSNRGQPNPCFMFPTTSHSVRMSRVVSLTTLFQIQMETSASREDPEKSITPSDHVDGDAQVRHDTPDRVATVERRRKTKREHGESFNTLSTILNAVKNHESAWPFLTPVDGKVVADYYDHVKFPMGVYHIAEWVNLFDSGGIFLGSVSSK